MRDAEAAFEELAALVREVRNLRTQAGSPAGAWIPLRRRAGRPGRGVGALVRAPSTSRRWRACARSRSAPTASGPSSLRPARSGPPGSGSMRPSSGAAGERRAAQLAELDANISAPRGAAGQRGVRRPRRRRRSSQRERQRLADLRAERRAARAANEPIGPWRSAGEWLVESPGRHARTEAPSRTMSFLRRKKQPMPSRLRRRHRCRRRSRAQEYLLRVSLVARSSDGLRLPADPARRGRHPRHRRAAEPDDGRDGRATAARVLRCIPGDRALQRGPAVGPRPPRRRVPSAATGSTFSR